MSDADDTVEIVIGNDRQRHGIPDQIGPCRIVRLLGVGRTGSVYLGTELRLQKDVAIKVPEKRFVSTQEQVDACMSQCNSSVMYQGIVRKLLPFIFSRHPMSLLVTSSHHTSTVER